MRTAGNGREVRVAGAMDDFISTYTNRLDAKGRVSIPAPFRSILAVDGSDGLYCCPTLKGDAVDAGGNRFREIISKHPPMIVAAPGNTSSQPRASVHSWFGLNAKPS